MLYHALVEWAKRRTVLRDDLGPRFYAPRLVKWFIDLDHNGVLQEIVPASVVGQPKAVLFAPYVPRTDAIRARLLADNCEYVLGINGATAGSSKTAARHRAFVAAIQACAKRLDEPSLHAVLRFLQNGPVPVGAVPPNLQGKDILTFRVAGVLPIALSSVQEYWATVAAPTSGSRMRCLVCNKVRLCPESHVFAVKGLQGGTAAGTVISSANASAFHSYGLEWSLVAPTCTECSERAGKALNRLLELDNHHLDVGPLTFVFWCAGAHFNPLNFIGRAKPSDVTSLLTGEWRSNRIAGRLKNARFYLAALTTNQARAVVRAFIDIDLEAAKTTLARYFDLQRIAEPHGACWQPLTLKSLMSSISIASAPKLRPGLRTGEEENELAAKLPEDVFVARTAIAFVQFMFCGGALPLFLLAEAVQRNRAEQIVTRSRAALIKMALLSQEEDHIPGSELLELEPGQRNPAYLCGRLLAVVGSLRCAAVPSLERAARANHYGVASTNPASIFPILLRQSEALRGFAPAVDRSDFRAAREHIDQITNLFGKRDFPAALTMVEQGLFALGYYFQQLHDESRRAAEG